MAWLREQNNRKSAMRGQVAPERAEVQEVTALDPWALGQVRISTPRQIRRKIFLRKSGGRLTSPRSSRRGELIAHPVAPQL
jgi:hypothetical protein